LDLAISVNNTEIRIDIYSNIVASGSTLSTLADELLVSNSILSTPSRHDDGRLRPRGSG
jgi:hypothetical protein